MQQRQQEAEQAGPTNTWWVPAIVAGLFLAAAAGPVLAAGAGNGYVMMLHGNWEPWVNDVSPIFLPPAPEAVATTQEAGNVEVFAIPYAVATGRPAVVQEAVLVIHAASAEPLAVRPNVAPAAARICQEETGIPGHEGPLEACHGFRLPAEALAGREVVWFTLLFSDARGPQEESYNVVGHYQLHGWMEGAPFTLQEADGHGTATPYVVQRLLDPMP